MGIVSSALGAMGGTSGSSGWNQSHSVGGTWGSGAAAMEFNREMMQAQQAFNAEEAQKNRDWQERMSNTAYQRAVLDMRKAGINPILAYQQGGATTPGGSAAAAGMAQGVTDSYNESNGMGVNSAYSYSNFAEGLSALAGAIADGFNAWGGIASFIGGGREVIGQMASSAQKAINNFIGHANGSVYGNGGGYQRYGHGREWK